MENDFIKKIGVLSIFCCALLISFLVHAQPIEQKKIFILNSYHSGFLFSDQEMEGIDKYFKGQYDKITISQVFMDTKRLTFEQADPIVYNNIKSVYGAPIKADVIITLDDNALDFAIKYRKELFGEIPIVFAGVNRFEPKRIRGVGNITGVPETLPAQENLELIPRLHPRISELVVLGDSTETAQYNIQNVLEAAKITPSYQTIRVTPKSEWSLAEIDRYLLSLDGNTTVVYVVDFFRDRNGLLIRPDFGTLFLNKYLNVPFYSHASSHKDGILGGFLLDAVNHGYRAAAIADKILNGVPPSKIPVDYGTESIPTFNYQKLKMFNVSLDLLPPRSVIEGMPIWENQAVVVVLQVVIILQILGLGVFTYVLHRK